MPPKSRHHGCRIVDYTQRGHTFLALENDLVRITVLLTKGADIVEFRHKPTDVDAMWHSSRPLPSLHGYVPEMATARDVFFDFFCGGWPESFPTGCTFGPYRGANLTVHGEVSVQPWDCTILEDTEQRIQVALDVECRRMPFRLRRVMTLARGEACVRLDETVENLGGQALDFAWGHHPSFGPPFLTGECVLDLPAGAVSTCPPGVHAKPRFQPGQACETPVVAGANGQSVDLRRVAPDHNGTTDNFEIRLSGEGRCALRNPPLGIGFGLQWDETAFPYLWEWEVSRGGDYPLWSRDYLVALEPFNCPLRGGLHTLGDKGILPRLAPGEKRDAWLVAGFCDGRREFAGDFLRRAEAPPAR